MLAGGYAGDFAGDPLSWLTPVLLYWVDPASKLQLRGLWTAAGEFPLAAGAIWVTEKDGAVVVRGDTSPADFTVSPAGYVPQLAAIAVPTGVSDANFNPLLGLPLQNLNSNFKILFQHKPRGRYRVEDLAQIKYELYRGVDVQPDFAAAPWQTFTSLPFTTPALTVGHTYYFVLRKRNQHNLLSQNVDATMIVVDAGGVLVNNPSAPSTQTIAAAAAGKARIKASYDYLMDAAAVRADTWAVWLTSTGVDPVLTNPPDYTEAMVQSDGQAFLDYTSAAGYTHGSTLKAVVRARRATGPVDSINTAVMSTLADANGPAAPANAQTFLGQSARQG